MNGLKNATNGAMYKVCLLILIAAFYPRVSHAQSCDVFVNPTDGSEGNSGTQFAPVQSMEQGFAISVSGQTVCLAAGEYFRGSDADGINLTGDKSVRFILQSYGGSSDIILSEESFTIAVGDNVITFAPETSQRLLLGEGVVNNPVLFPDARNYLHSLAISSGVLDFGVTEVIVGTSVGNPSYVHPDKPEQGAISDAVIRLGGQITGSNISYETATRNWILNGGNPSQDRALSLPIFDSPTHLTFSNSGPIRVETPLEMPSGSTFTVSDASSATVQLEKGVLVSGDVSLSHSGSSQLSLNVIQSSPGHFSLENAGPGNMTIDGIQGHENGTIYLGHEEGVLTLNENASFHGGLNASSAVNIEGNVVIEDATGFDVLLISGPFSVDTGTISLINVQPEAIPVQILETAEMSGNAIQLTGSFSLIGGGSASVSTLGPALVDNQGVEMVGGFVLESNSTLKLGASPSSVKGTLTIAGGQLELTSPRVFISKLVMTAGEIVPQDHSLVLSRELDLIGGTYPPLSVSIENGNSVPIRANAPLLSLDIINADVISNSSLLIEGSCSLSQGELVISIEHTVQCVSIATSSASQVTIGTRATLHSNTFVDLRNGILTADNDSKLSFGTDFWLSNTQSAPTSLLTLVWTGINQSLFAPPVSDWKSFNFNDASGQVTLSGDIRVEGELDTSPVSVLLTENSVLRLRNSLVTSLQGIAGQTTSSIILEGTGSVSGIDGNTVLLPSTTINGNAFFQSPIDINGDLVHLSGVASFANGLNVIGNLDASSSEGIINIQPGKTISISGSTTLTSGLLRLFPESIIRVSDTVTIASSNVDFTSGALTLFGTSTVSLSAPLSVALLSLEPSTIASFNGESTLVTVDSLRVGTEAELMLNELNIDIGTPTTSPRAHIDGTVRTDELSTIRFLGLDGSLSGDGSLENVVLSLSTEQNELTLSSSTFTLRRSIALNNGLLKLNTTDLRFDSAEAFSIWYTVSNDRFLSRMERINGAQINTGNVPIDVYFDGQVSGFVPMDFALEMGPLHSLSVSVVDVLNTTPLFGLSNAERITLSGSLNVSSNALIRSPSILIVDPDKDSVIAGRVDSLLIRGSTSLFGGESGVIGVLEHENGSLSISGLTQLNSIKAVSSSLSILDSSELKIAKDLTLIDASLSTFVPIILENPTQIVSFGSQRSDLVFDASGSLIFRTPSTVFIDGQSSITSLDPTIGRIDLTASSDLTINSPISSVRLSGEDTRLTLNGNLEIADLLDSSGGTLTLGTWDLVLSSSVWNLDNTRVISNPNSNSSKVALLNGSTIRLTQDAIFEQTNLLVTTDSEPAQLTTDDLTPHSITLQNGTLSVQNGILNLNNNDLIIQGNNQPVLSLDGAQIIGNTTYADWETASHFQPVGISPFEHTSVGEIVIDGPAGSEIASNGLNQISALRLEKSVNLTNNGAALLITDRFSFGNLNAPVQMGREGSLAFASGASIVRRGGGALSHAPVFNGPVNLAFNLDDGSSGGIESSFTGEQVVTGFEIPPVEIGVSNLNILAGNHGDQSHTIVLDRPLRVLESLQLLSGQFAGNNQQIVLNENAVLSVFEMDLDAPAQFSLDAPFEADNVIDVQIRSLSDNLLISDSYFPVNGRVRTYKMDAGDYTTGQRSRMLLNANHDADVVQFSGNQNSTLVLLGVELAARDTLELISGTVQSDQFSSLTSNNVFLLQDQGTVAGNIVVEVAGKATLNGEMSALELVSTGNIFVNRTWDPASSLTLSGTEQTLSFTTNHLSIGNLTLQSPTQSGRFLLEGSPGSTFEVMDRLQLKSGILIGNNTSVMVSPNSVVFQSDSSWVNAPIEANLESSFEGDVVFPIGSSSRSRPITLSIPTQLLAASTFGVSVTESEPLLKPGLPIAEAGINVADTGDFYWTLTSSVNFGSVQPFSIGTTLQGGNVGEVSLLTLERGKSYSNWKSGPVATGQNVTSGELDVGLSPAGTRISSGVTTRRSEWGFIQFIDEWTNESNNEVDLYVNEELWISDVSPNEVTPAIPVAMDATNTSVLLASASTHGVNRDENILAVNELDVATHTLTHLVQVRNAATVPALLSTGPVVASTGNRILFLGNPSDVIRLSFPWPIDITLIENLPGRQVSEVLDASLSLTTVKVSLGTASSLFTNVPTLPEGPFPGLVTIKPDLSLDVISGNGIRTIGIVSTSTSPDEGLPQTFGMDHPFPNPSHSTVQFNLTSEGPSQIHLDILDTLGRVVLRQALSAQTGSASTLVTLDLGSLASGVYFIVAKQDGKRSTRFITLTR